MKHAIGCAHFCKCLKCIRHAFFSTSKTDMNLSRQVVSRTPRRPANVLGLRTLKWFFGEFLQSVQWKYFFEMLMDECPKYSNSVLSSTPMVASGWMKEDHR